MLRRFEREARATAALSSPHTIQLFDFGLTDEGTFYYVMELLIGRDLETLVRDFGPLPAERAMFLLRQVCHSLADAHARGLVHRDIKPANIYVCRMGLDYDFVKVLDFGLVKFKDRRVGARRQLADLRAPRRPGRRPTWRRRSSSATADVDRRADVYALGCVAYYLLTGQLVFEADTPMKMLMQHVQARPVPPSQRTELPIPRELDALVLSCLEKDPNKRPQNAEELFRMAWGCTACDTWNQELRQPLVADAPARSDRTADRSRISPAIRIAKRRQSDEHQALWPRKAGSIEACRCSPRCRAGEGVQRAAAGRQSSSTCWRSTRF